MAIGTLKSAFSQGLMASSATQMEELGTLRALRDGRKFRYVKADATGLGAGKLCIAPVVAANHINLAMPAAAAIGTTQIALTVGATAVTADQYAEGFLQVNDGTGFGLQYKIDSNTACDASGSTVVQLAEPIAVALVATTSEVSLIPSLYKAVGHTTTPESEPVGIACCAIAANYYGWVQTCGQGIALIAGTPAVGTMLTVSATSGALAAVNATFDIDQPIFARTACTVGVAAEFKPVTLFID